MCCDMVIFFLLDKKDVYRTLLMIQIIVCLNDYRNVYYNQEQETNGICSFI